MPTPRVPLRRGVAAGLAPAVAVLAVLSACSGTDVGESSAAGAGTPVSGGTLTFAVNSDGSCLDPHQSPADVDGLFARPIVDSLVSLGADGTITPWLSTQWSVSADQLTYSFTLRGDVTFSNGEKFDGAAVKANLDHIVNPATKSQLAAGTIATYAGTTVVDPTHIQVKFKSPNSAFLPSLGWIDFDPTNAVFPGERHVTVAWGRDFSDVSPLRGIVLGGGQHSLAVAVDVTPEE